MERGREMEEKVQREEDGGRERENKEMKEKENGATCISYCKGL